MNQNSTLNGLYRRWGLVTLLFTLTLWPGYVWLQTAWSPADARRWLILAAAVLAYEVWLFWRGLPHNHHPGETNLLPTLGAGNLLTLLRGLWLAWLAGFLFAPWPPGGLVWLPALFYTLAALADGFDGYLARVTHHATKLGETLDMEFDAVGVLVAATLIVIYGQAPWWYLSLGLARYLFVLGLWWRAKRGRPVYSLTPSTTRRLMAGFCMGFGTVMLWPIVRPPATVLGGIVLTVPFLAGFLRDWLVVSGQLDPAAPAYLAARRKLALIITYWLPVILRLLTAFIAISFIVPSLRSTASLTATFTWPGLPWPALFAPLIGWLGLAAAGLVVLGLLGRLAALGLVIPAMANILNADLRLDNGLLLVAALMLLLFGTGAFSLWQPEETWLNRRPGEKRYPLTA